MKIILAFVFAIALPFSALAEESRLPKGYDSWLVALNETCGNLRLEVRQMVDRQGQKEARVMWWNDQLINTSVYIEKGDKETDVVSGLEYGEWVSIEVIDDDTEDDAELLVQGSIMQAGGKQAVDSYGECEARIQQQFMDEMEQMGPVFEGLLDALL